MVDELKERCRACSQGCIYPSECSYFDKPPLRCMRQLLSEAADAIEQLSNAGSAYGRGWTLGYDAGREESKPRWIPVTERLPKEEKEIYWCYTNMGIMCECRWTNNRFGVGESDRWGWNIMDVPQYQKVTHWMPLPEPPTAEGET